MRISSGFPRVLQQLHRIATANDFNSSSPRVFSSWRYHKRNYSWKQKITESKTVNSKILFALIAGFSFKDHGISEEKFTREEEIDKEFDDKSYVESGWEILVNEPDFRALRRKLKGSEELYEYKCAGSYYDITPKNFLDAQNNLSYRKEWDSNIISLELLAENKEQELLRWISKFPYPMSAREYVYVRRTWISNNGHIVVVESDVVPENVVPSLNAKSNVRVVKYTSRMAIRAHGDWNDHGLDFILTYSDNPEANIPRYIYNWLINQGGPYFLKQVHAAALHLELSGRGINSVMEKYQRPVEETKPEEVMAPDVITTEESSDEEIKKEAQEETSKSSKEPKEMAHDIISSEELITTVQEETKTKEPSEPPKEHVDTNTKDTCAHA